MITGLTALFVIMICLPFAFSVAYYKKTQGIPLAINQTRKKDNRYFGHSFREKLKIATVDQKKQTVKIHYGESYLTEADLGGEGETVDKLIIGFNEDISLPNTIRDVKKEIYSGANIACVGGGSITCRAICAEGDIHIEKNLMIERWMDAEGTVEIEGDCDLGINTASGREIILKGHSIFRRLYAPVICVGEKREPDKIDVSEETEKKDIISKKGVEISENACVNGSIRSGKFIKICNNAVVCGNLFADGGIVIGDNARILGNVFSQEDVFVGNNVTIGQKDDIRSIISRGRIHLAPGDVVYGLASCEKEGEIMNGSFPPAE